MRFVSIVLISSILASPQAFADDNCPYKREILEKNMKGHISETELAIIEMAKEISAVAGPEEMAEIQNICKTTIVGAYAKWIQAALSKDSQRIRAKLASFRSKSITGDYEFQNALVLSKDLNDGRKSQGIQSLNSRYNLCTGKISNSVKLVENGQLDSERTSSGRLSMSVGNMTTEFYTGANLPKECKNLSYKIFFIPEDERAKLIQQTEFLSVHGALMEHRGQNTRANLN